jgi:hypothetical protein
MTSTEQSGQVATGIIAGLKQQPMLLGLLAINLIFVLLIFFGVGQQRTLDQKTMDMLYNCTPTKPLSPAEGPQPH